MADKKNYAVIASLEKQLSEHTANFEQWKLDNSRQKGTPSYNDYVAKFADWERDIRARIAAHQGHMTAESGPQNVDSILDELLDNVGIYEFMFALANMHMSDKTFIQSFVEELGKIQRTGVAEPSIIVPAAQFYPTYSNNSYGYNQVHSSSPNLTAWSSRPATTPTSAHLKRAASPIRDFQKKATPFRDFSV